MTNKYRGVNIEPVVAPSRDPEIVEGSFEGGMVLARNAQQIELNQSPKHDRVRVELGGLRADYGVLQLGNTTAEAGQKVYALGEHRFILAGTTLFEQIFRLYHNGGVANTITYNGGAALTSLEVTAANEITSVGTTSFVGVISEGDIIYLTDMSTAANNNVYCRVTTVAANKLTLAGTPLTIQAADSGCSLFQLPSVALIDSLDDSDPDPDNWEWDAEIDDGGTDKIEVLNTLLSWESFLNQVFFADGDKVFRWDHSTLIPDEGNDFPTENSLVALDESTDVVVNPAGAALDLYTVHFSCVVTGPSEEGGYVWVSVWHMGLELAYKQLDIAQSSDTDRIATFSNVSIELPPRAIALNDIVTLKLSALVAPSVARRQDLERVGTSTVYEATPKVPAREADGKAYTFTFKISGSESNLTVEFYFDYDGVGYLLNHTASTYSSGVKYDLDLVADDNAADVVGFKAIIVEDPEIHTFVSFYYVSWEESFEVEVHGFNLATDDDPNYGIEYSTEGVQQNDLLLVKPDPAEPESEENVVGRYLGVIADRLVVLQSGGDPQRARWCVNGMPLDWVGEGSGDTAVTPVISRSDPIDALMALKMLTSSVGVLFRQRSIMRAIPTGQVNPAIAFYPWIEKLGTESPFSVVTTPYGIVFLGHDKQIYLLTESGQQAIGVPINESFNITTPADVEATYDPITQEYILSIPEDH